MARVLFATFNDPSTRLNQLTGPHLDTHTNTPEYKVTAVRVERSRAPHPVDQSP